MARRFHPEQKSRAQKDARSQRTDPADRAARGLSEQKGRWRARGQDAMAGAAGDSHLCGRSPLRQGVQ